MMKKILCFFVLLFATVLLTYGPPVLAQTSGPQIYWGTLSGIHRSSLDGSNVETLFSQERSLFSIALDMAAGKIYWGDLIEEKVWRSSLDGSNVETLVTGVRPWSIALDAAAGKIYWGGGYGKIMRADLDGTNIETIITNPDYAAQTNDNLNYRVASIALDVEGGKIYWTEYYRVDSGKIKRANLNGTSIETLVSGHRIRDIALDVEGGKMYWTDDPYIFVRRANLDGTDAEVILTDDQFITQIALDVEGGKIYWTLNSFTNDPVDKIKRADLNSTDIRGTNVETIVSGMVRIGDIVLNLSTADVSDTASMDGITISEIMVASKGGRLPQWIELHNPSDIHAVNLKGWTLEIQNRRSTNFKGRINATLTFKDGTVEPQETLLIISKQDRASNHFQNEQIYNLNNQHPNLQDMVLSEEGFYLKLSNAAGETRDEVGNLDGKRNTDDKPAWSLPKSLTEEDTRASMIRTHDDKGPRLGTDASGWVSAINTKLLTGTTSYYGHPGDIGAPGVKSGGALPVKLSGFRAERTDTDVVVRWITESELNNAGFNILRGETKNSEFKVVNPQLIQGAGTTSERREYMWTDTTAKPNVVYYYRIEDVSHAGERKQLATVRMSGYVSAAGKLATKWGDLKLQE